MVELVTAAGILAILMLASAAAMGRSVDSTKDSHRMTRGAVLLESVQEDLAALAPEDLLSMNGQVIFDREDTANADHHVEITVFHTSIRVVQFQLALIDQRSGRMLGSIHGRRALV